MKKNSKEKEKLKNIIKKNKFTWGESDLKKIKKTLDK